MHDDPILWQDNIIQGVSPDILPLKTENDLESFLGILNYLLKFSPVTAEVCEPLCKPTSDKQTGHKNRTYEDLYEKALNSGLKRNTHKV